MRNARGDRSCGSLSLAPRGYGALRAMAQRYHPVQLLLVEDSPGDMRLTREVFRDTNSAVQLHVAADGVEAMAFLRHEGAHVAAPRPDPILLDLNLPKLDGRKVLAQIKEDSSLTVSYTHLDVYKRQSYCSTLTAPWRLDSLAPSAPRIMGTCAYAGGAAPSARSIFICRGVLFR